MQYFDFLDDAQLATVHRASPECEICYMSPEPLDDAQVATVHDASLEILKEGG